MRPDSDWARRPFKRYKRETEVGNQATWGFHGVLRTLRRNEDSTHQESQETLLASIQFNRSIVTWVPRPQQQIMLSQPASIYPDCLGSPGALRALSRVLLKPVDETANRRKQKLYRFIANVRKFFELKLTLGMRRQVDLKNYNLQR